MPRRRLDSLVCWNPSLLEVTTDDRRQDGSLFVKNPFLFCQTQQSSLTRKQWTTCGESIHCCFRCDGESWGRKMKHFASVQFISNEDSGVHSDFSIPSNMFLIQMEIGLLKQQHLEHLRGWWFDWHFRPLFCRFCASFSDCSLWFGCWWCDFFVEHPTWLMIKQMVDHFSMLMLQASPLFFLWKFVVSSRLCLSLAWTVNSLIYHFWKACMLPLTSNKQSCTWTENTTGIHWCSELMAKNEGYSKTQNAAYLARRTIHCFGESCKLQAIIWMTSQSEWINRDLHASLPPCDIWHLSTFEKILDYVILTIFVL